MKHFLLLYTLSPDYVERRQPYRDEHLRRAWAAHARGELLLGGAISDPIDTALLVFRGDSPRAATEFAAHDPYVVHGVVTSWRVREWLTVVGTEPASPVHPPPAEAAPRT